MRRSLFGFILMIALLVIGIAAAVWMEEHHTLIAEDLAAASRCAIDGDWENARYHVVRAEEAWQKQWCRDAALTDHQPMEEIDSLFSRLAVFGELKDTGEFSAGCRELCRRVEALSDVHGIQWWNFL